MKIKDIWAEKILDSRKQETIKVFVKTAQGTWFASSPSGKSIGKHETPAFCGSVDESMRLLKMLSENIKNTGIEKFEDLDEIEKISDKKEIGANTLFALEAGILKALAYEQKKQIWELINPESNKMPWPIGNVIGGGLHTESIKRKRPDFQEFLIIPKLKRFSDNVNVMKKAHEIAGERLKLRKSGGKLNDENAWITSLDNETCLEVLNQTRDEIEQEIDEKIEIGIDAASSCFYSGLYHYKNPERLLNEQEQVSYLAGIADKFDVFYIEDPFNEEDFKSFRLLKGKLPGRMIVGDDLTVSSVARFLKALKERAINALILKPNQQGSLVDIKRIVYLAKKYNILTIMSHRSGETLDSTIADLAFGFQCDYVKMGVIGKEREAKLKRLVEIEKRFV